jgi:hypothetical protein
LGVNLKVLDNYDQARKSLLTEEKKMMIPCFFISNGTIIDAECEI